MALAVLLAPVGAHAFSLEPYDGSNPFRCELQELGTGVAFPTVAPTRSASPTTRRTRTSPVSGS